MRTPLVQKYFALFFLLPALGCGGVYPKAKASDPSPFLPSVSRDPIITSADGMEIDPLLFSPENPAVRLPLPVKSSSEIPLRVPSEKRFLSLQLPEEMGVEEPLPSSLLPLASIEEKANWSPEILPRLPAGSLAAKGSDAAEGDQNGGGEEERNASMEDFDGENSTASQPLSIPNRLKDEASRLQRLFGSPLFSPSLSMEAGKEHPSGGGRPIADVLVLFPSLFHERVRQSIQYFQTQGEDFFSASLARSRAYEPMIKHILREKNLPEEFFYLALIESGYKPNAQSKAKATGIWQLMAQTARRFGLQVNQWIDERRDPEKSTRAAAAYLKSLYELFQCWELAVASYNAGEGKILAAIKKSHSQDFWEISKHRYLKQETKKFVPKFLAAVTIARDPHLFGFGNTEDSPRIASEKVLVPPGTRLDRIARAAETELSQIRALNPALIKWKTPPQGAPIEIRIPRGKMQAFEKNFPLKQDDIALAKRHRIRQGETLWQIAKRYQVHLQDLCEFNQITPKALIRPGATLLLPP
jgi:triphosphoribosyl-dephospho-CoA synthetase